MTREYTNLRSVMGWQSTEIPGREAMLCISYLVGVSNACPQSRTLSYLQAKSGLAFENLSFETKRGRLLNPARESLLPFT